MDEGRCKELVVLSLSVGMQINSMLVCSLHEHATCLLCTLYFRLPWSRAEEERPPIRYVIRAVHVLGLGLMKHFLR